MTDQNRTLMAMIGMVVSRLDQLGEIVPAVQHLGRRHAEYGVEDEHYDTVGTALLSTLRTGLGGCPEPRSGRSLGGRLRDAGGSHEAGVCRGSTRE
jgi:hemoglobin-like flavoprotein